MPSATCSRDSPSRPALGEDRRYEASVFLGNQIARSDMKVLRDDKQVLGKHIYDYLFHGDGSDVEVRLAKAMEMAEEVVVYAKLRRFTLSKCTHAAGPVDASVFAAVNMLY